MRRVVQGGVFAWAMATALPAGADIAMDAGIEADREVLRILRNLIEKAETVEELANRWEQVFHYADLDGEPGLNDRDLQTMQAMGLADNRIMSATQVLRYDLNGDYIVTADELRPFALQLAAKPIRSGDLELQPSPDQRDEIIDRFIDTILQRDTDGNGQIDTSELAQLDQRDVERLARPRGIGASLAVLDGDRDGTVTLEEHRAVLAALTAGLDTDADGRLSKEERKNFLQVALERPREVSPEQVLIDSYLSPPCDLGRVPDHAEVAVISANEGSALSTVRIADSPRVTHVIDVVVPEGAEPLFVVADLSTATILRFSGAVQRVNGLIGLDKPVAAIGVKRSQLKVFGTKTPPCLSNLWSVKLAGVAPDKVEAVAAAARAETMAALTKALGKVPVALVTAESLTTVDLAAGTALPPALLPGARKLPTTGPAAEVWAEVMRWNPGGLVEIDPETVVSLFAFAPYEVLPQEAGLAQLVEAGLLKPQSRGEAQDIVTEDETGRVVIDGSSIYPGGGDDMIRVKGLVYTEEAPGRWIGRTQAEYIVEGEITLPEGLDGAHAVIFVLPPDKPMPKGDRGGSKIRPLEP